jgi:flagellar motility protein MotE (MotC chaperone)
MTMNATMTQEQYEEKRQRRKEEREQIERQAKQKVEDGLAIWISRMTPVEIAKMVARGKRLRALGHE